MYRWRQIVPVLACACLTLSLARSAEDIQITHWKQKAAAGDADAEMRLGEAYAYGKGGLTRDYAQAMALFQKAAAQNNAAAESDIGWFYRAGYGVPRDDKQAFEWFTKGANGGNPYGQTQLGLCYNNGRGVAKDLTQAVAWYTKAARQGNDEAMTQLGLCLEQGVGTPVDLRQGFTYLLAAAYDNYGWAQYCVARNYEAGLFVSKNLTEAWRWGLLAIKNNGYREPGSSHFLFYLSTHLTPAQFSDAQTLVKNWDQECAGNLQPLTATVAFDAKQPGPLIPLQDIDDELVISATVNGHANLHFLVDTGCNMSLINEKTAAAIGFPPSSVYRPAQGIGPNRVLMSQINHVDLQLPGVTFSGFTFCRTSLSDWDEHIGVHLDGVLGADLLKHTVMRVDYIHHTLELLDPAAFKPPQEVGAVLPFTFAQGSLMFITGIVGNQGVFSAPTQLLVDTGSGSSINLNQEFARTNSTLSLKGGPASRAGGLGGIMSYSTVRIDELKLGDVVIDNPDGAIALADQGIVKLDPDAIGNEIWRRFDLTIDYPNRKLYLKPNARFGDPFYYTSSGMEVIATGTDFRTYVVDVVAPDTPASRASLKKGDVLTQFDGVKLATQDLRQVRELLRQPGKHTVGVTRDGKPVTLDYVRDDIPTLKAET